MNDWLTTREFAAMLEVSEETIRRMCRTKQLRCAGLSGRLDAKRFTWRVHRDALDQMVGKG